MKEREREMNKHTHRLDKQLTNNFFDLVFFLLLDKMENPNEKQKNKYNSTLTLDVCEYET